MSKTRAIRFSDTEDHQIEEFLKKNSFLDFSSLARLAILSFIREPKITVEPVGRGKSSAERRGRVYGQSEQ
jgi:hypothetical protein